MAFLEERLRPTAPTGSCAPALYTGLLGGAAAAATGLAAVALPLFLLWIVSPYVEAGSGGVLHLAAGLWLLAHGAELGYAATPVGVPPLLLTAAAVVLLYRVAARAARQAGAAAAGPLLLGLCAGYLLGGVAVFAVAAASAGSPSVRPAGAALGLLLVALPAAAAGVRSGAGPYRVSLLPRTRTEPPAWSRRLLRRGRCLLDRLYVPGGAVAAARAAAGAGATLLGGGALVFAVSLLLRFGTAGTISAQLAPDLVGRFALLLLCAVMLPNAAVWAAAYALGPGFALGGGFAPLSTAAVTPPAFPLFAALPSAGRSPLGLLTLVVPAAAGVVAALLLGRAAGDWGVLATARAGLAAAGCAGAAVAVCAAASGGALGTSALAYVGPSPWWTGLAALVWTALVGIPGALLVRWQPWSGRGAQPAPGLAPGPTADPAPEPGPGPVWDPAWDPATWDLDADPAWDPDPDSTGPGSDGLGSTGPDSDGPDSTGPDSNRLDRGVRRLPGFLARVPLVSLRASPASAAAWARRCWRRCCRRPE